MSYRRTSGEIINATLLEIFLSLVFIIFALAVWEHGRAEAATRAQRSASLDQRELADAKAAAKKAMEQQAALESRNKSLADSLNRTIDSLRFTSREPANCEAEGLTPEFISIVLAGPNQLRVTVNRTRLSHLAGTVETLTSEAFIARFADVNAYSRSNWCRFRAHVRDSDAVSKADYKRSLSAISTTFRLRGFLN